MQKVALKRLGDACRVWDSVQDCGFSFETGDIRDVSADLARELMQGEGWALPLVPLPFVTEVKE